jgi:hypothetical protein
MSNEQRAYFEMKRSELMQTNPEFFSMEEIERFPVWRNMHWPTFKKFDNWQIGRHPIDVAFKSLEELRRVHEFRINEVNSALATGFIDEITHEAIVYELTKELDRIEGQFCVKARRYYITKYEEDKFPCPLGTEGVNESIKRRIAERRAISEGESKATLHVEE